MAAQSNEPGILRYVSLPLTPVSVHSFCTVAVSEQEHDMFASAVGAADDSNNQVVQLATIKGRRRQAASLQVLMGMLDTAQANGHRDQAEALIAAIYKRCDAAMVSNTREAGTP